MSRPNGTGRRRNIKKKKSVCYQTDFFQRHEKKYYFLDKKSLTCVDSTTASLNV